jgi:hypothetical protein
MTISQHALGVTYPPTNIELFDPPLPAVMRCTPELWSVITGKLDGNEAGHGFPYTVWLFQFLVQLEVNALKSICTVGGVLQKSRAVYIRTRTPEDHDQFADYQAIMHWPQVLPDTRRPGGTYHNVEFRFSRLIPYVP